MSDTVDEYAILAALNTLHAELKAAAAAGDTQRMVDIHTRIGELTAQWWQMARARYGPTDTARA